MAQSGNNRAMPNVHIYQIYYSDETKAALDPDFIALDNAANERPDWREYWPIRKFLLGNTLVPEDYYGFLSPKFFPKTNLKADAVFDFVRSKIGHAEVVLFSPGADYGAFFFSVFEQAEVFHPGFALACQQFVDRADIALDLKKVVTDSTNTVFSNFFVASGRFWATWSAIADTLFRICEDRDHPLQSALTARAAYGEVDVQFKVFVVERIATLILLSQPDIQASAYSPYHLSWSRFPAFHNSQREALLCDALKIAFRRQGYPQFIEEFVRIRNDVFAKGQPRGAKTVQKAW